jgi:hypothetical protein
MKCWTVTMLAAAIAASGALAQDREAYNLKAATADLAVFHKHARDGVLKREDVRSDLDFGPRFDQADFDRDGVVTATEMDRYIRQTYDVSPSSAGTGTTDAYRLHAATRDLEAFHQLARGGAVSREEAQAHPLFGPRFDEADYNRDGRITAQEMERYVREAHGVIATSTRPSGSASVGSGTPRPAGSGSASAGSSGR